MNKNSLRQRLTYNPIELDFGTSGLRGKVIDMTDLEVYINTAGFVAFLLDSGDIKPGQVFALSGDLRQSTPRIEQVVVTAIMDAGCTIDYAQTIPTPALAYWAFCHDQPAVMVTGSHIPGDRNGIKFYKKGAEVLKSDEQAIKNAVDRIRTELYDQDYEHSIFSKDGELKDLRDMPHSNGQILDLFRQRYQEFFPQNFLHGKKIVVYEHSSVGRDAIKDLLVSFGADVIGVDRSDAFVPIDTENVTPENQEYFKKLAKEHEGVFAILSLDGDSDRPFIVDELGNFQRGDLVGVLVAMQLQASSVAIPVSVNDAVTTQLKNLGVPYDLTRIGSPYVIDAMKKMSKNNGRIVAGWEVNGGFLLGTDIKNDTDVIMRALQTRDAFLPIFVVLHRAVSLQQKLSEVFSSLPQRFTQAGLIDNFPQQSSSILVNMLTGTKVYGSLGGYFKASNGFSNIDSVDATDGARLHFDNDEIVHIRPSGNAPQLRVYSNASTQQRANEIVALCLAEPSGVLRRLEKDFTEQSVA